VAVRIPAEAVVVGHREAVDRTVLDLEEAGNHREAAAVQIAVLEGAGHSLDTAEEDIDPGEDRAAVHQLGDASDAFLPGSDHASSRAALLAAELHPERRATDNSLGRRVGPERRGHKVVAESSLSRIGEPSNRSIEAGAGVSP